MFLFSGDPITKPKTRCRKAPSPYSQPYPHSPKLALHRNSGTITESSCLETTSPSLASSAGVQLTVFRIKCKFFGRAHKDLHELLPAHLIGLILATPSVSALTGPQQPSLGSLLCLVGLLDTPLIDPTFCAYFLSGCSLNF